MISIFHCIKLQTTSLRFSDCTAFLSEDLVTNPTRKKRKQNEINEYKVQIQNILILFYLEGKDTQRDMS